MTKRLTVVIALVLCCTAAVLLHGKVSALTKSSKTVNPGPTATSWTFCVNAGNVCLFTGLRVVRLADSTGTKSVTQIAYHSVPCAGYGFGNQYPSSGPLHCDYGPAMLDTLVVPQKMGPITTERIIVPKASPGVSVAQVQDGGGGGVHTDGSGSFRTTCSLAKFAFEDPIVYPGRSGVSHLHMFFGNTAMDANTTTASIVDAGNSTCRGGILNRTAYWTPAVIDGNGVTVMPEEGTFYYKTGYNMKAGEHATDADGVAHDRRRQERKGSADRSGSAADRDVELFDAEHHRRDGSGRKEHSRRLCHSAELPGRGDGASHDHFPRVLERQGSRRARP